MTACPPPLVFTISTLFLASARTVTVARAAAAAAAARLLLVLAATAHGNAPTKDDGSDVEEGPRGRAVEADRRPDAEAHRAIAGGVAGQERCVGGE